MRLVPLEIIIYQSDVLHPNKSNVESRLPLENDLSGIPTSTEPQHPREFHSSKYIHVLLVNFEN
jgi:hypothetical protein